MGLMPFADESPKMTGFLVGGNLMTFDAHAVDARPYVVVVST